jgi:uncharacterized repeat protein (TIGR01451 family)
MLLLIGGNAFSKALYQIRRGIMVRKPFVALLVLFICILFLLAGLIANTGAIAQEEISPEGMRPDQFSYHGREDIPFLPSQSLPSVDMSTPSSPVEQWSKMVFESYVNNAGWEIYYASGSFTNLVRLTNNTTADIHPRLNRGCTSIVFASYRDNHDYEIYKINPDGTGLVRLTNNSTDDVKPAWSPDGTHIAFQSYRSGNAEVYVMNADGTGQTRLTNSGTYAGEPSWSPDGSRIAYTAYINSVWRIWAMDADGTHQTQLSQQPYSENPVWSPDGKTIAYDADDDSDGWQELWLMDADGSDQALFAEPLFNNSTILTNGWSPDNVSITFTQLHMVYIGGQWYWDYAGLYKADIWGSILLINGNRQYDWSLDWSPTDNVPPTADMSVPLAPVPYEFTVSWWGADSGIGLLTYDVQYRDGTNGAWIEWVMDRFNPPSETFTGIGGHTYYFRVRARDQVYNVGNWRTYSTSVESFPPRTDITPLDPYTRGNKVNVAWGGIDAGGSGILDYDVQYKKDISGIWQNWQMGTISTTVEFTGQTGHTYWFRARATDNAMNIEPWREPENDASTTFFSWRTSGTIGDNTGVPIVGADVTVDPSPFLVLPSDLNGHYEAYLAENPAQKIVSWSKDGYTDLPVTSYGYLDANVEVTLPPMDNHVQDSGFEDAALPGAWQMGGVYTPTLDDLHVHSGSFAASLGLQAQLDPPISIGNMGYSIDSDFDPIAVDSVGGVHLAWGNYENGYFIYYAHRMPDGTWLPAELVTQPTSNLWNIRVFVDDYQTIRLVYVTDTGLYYTSRDENGIWSEPLFVHSGGWLSQMMIDRDSTLHLIIPTNGQGVFYARIQHDQSWEIELIPAEYPQIYSDFSIDSNGTLHLVWPCTAYGRVCYITRNEYGTWSSQVVIADGVYAYHIHLVLDSSGAPLVVWDTRTERNQLNYLQKNPDGTWTTPLLISGDTNAVNFKMQIDDQDTLHVVWLDNNYVTGSGALYYVRKNHFEAWTAPLDISNSTGSPADTVSLAVSGEDVYAAWWADNNGDFGTYFAQMHAGVWNPPVKIVDLATTFPVVAIDALGGVNIAYSTGDLMYIGTTPVLEAGDSRIYQSFTVPVTMTNPTLSFLASLSGVSAISGNEFQVLVSDSITTTTIFTSTTPTGWEHYWFDISPWSGEQITLTFQVTENEGFPPASALLDEVTLGAAHTDVWVDLQADKYYVQPGDQFTYQLDYGNRSSIVASTNVITVSLDSGLNFISASLPPEINGDSLVWRLDELMPDIDYEPIIITVEVDLSIPSFQTLDTKATVNTATPEIELFNNTDQPVVIVAYPSFLPIMQR